VEVIIGSSAHRSYGNWCADVSAVQRQNGRPETEAHCTAFAWTERRRYCSWLLISMRRTG